MPEHDRYASPCLLPLLTPAARLRGLQPDWLNDPKVWRTEVLAGLVVALALIPEAISFSIIAGVDPAVGLFASFTMAVVISIVGGRRAMISAATGAIALVIAPLNREHGLGYLIAAVILAGVIQVVLGALGVAKLMRFVPRSVMVGFVNALAILIFMAQVPEMHDVPWPVYPLIIGGLALMVFFPKVTKVIPAPLVSIVILTVITVAAGIAVPTVGDKGDLPSSLPVPGLPDVPFTMDTLTTIAPYAFAMALVGLMESLMTAKLVDDITDTHSSKTRESIGQGIANIVTGFFGGMGGCAMIGQTMINVKVSGARTRLSTFLAGVVPDGAVHRLRPGRLRHPHGRPGRRDGDGVVRDVRLALHRAQDAQADARRGDRRHGHHRDRAWSPPTTSPSASSSAPSPPWSSSPSASPTSPSVTAVLDPDGTTVVYRVTGELFFASSNDLVGQFDYAGDPDKVVIDLSDAHIWDASSVAALDAIETKYAQRGKTVEIIGLNDPSADLHGKLTGELTGSH